MRNLRRFLAIGALLACAASMYGQNAVLRTGENIVAEPRRQTEKTALPDDGSGIYIGSGVYKHDGSLNSTGFCYTYWVPDHPTFDEIFDLCLREKVGNTLQFWQGGKEGVELGRKAYKNGLYSTYIYGEPGETAADTKAMVRKLGSHYLGYDFGERFTFSLYTSNKETEEEAAGRGATLRSICDDLMRRVNNHVTALHEKGLGNVMATSSNFSLDYEVAAGAEVPCVEDFPFGDLNLATALSRGLYRQYDLPMWCSHLAHEWYSWIPHSNPYKMRTLKTAFQLKYMSGAKMIINESGNWALQSSLCTDSPMSRMPILLGTPPGLYKMTDERSGYTEEILEEARKSFSLIDDKSPVATEYRRIISDFYAFCLEHPAPAGQPEAPFAVAKGNFDLATGTFVSGYAVGNAYSLANMDQSWYQGLPEKSWETMMHVLLPRRDILAPNYNLHFSGTPYGQFDIVSFAYDNVTAGHLLKNYRALMFSGWNTCSPKQYQILCDYVKGGGRLVIGLCHLSTDETRKYANFTVDDLVNGGDFSELCGLKVTGRGDRFYWATGPSVEPNELGFVARRRWGYMGLPLGNIEYTLPSDHYDLLAVDDEQMRPVILRCRVGKGEVYFLNTWSYPAAANQDVGPGAVADSKGMVGELYSYVARISRGHVFITGADMECPDADCDYISYSYFPDAGVICMLNMDYEHERKCVLHQFGSCGSVTLAPGEFRLIESVKLSSEEKINEE